jgi:hypothetical protein
MAARHGVEMLRLLAISAKRRWREGHSGLTVVLAGAGATPSAGACLDPGECVWASRKLYALSASRSGKRPTFYLTATQARPQVGGDGWGGWGD